ncbi:hypothetical protein Tco_0378604 [Tanacetum coccineum]
MKRLARSTRNRKTLVEFVPQSVKEKRTEKPSKVVGSSLAKRKEEKGRTLIKEAEEDIAAAKAIHFLDKLLLYDDQERTATKEVMIAITRKGDFKSFSDGNRFYN